MLPFQFIDVLHLHNDLAAVILLKDLDEEVMRAIVIEDQIADEDAGLSAGLSLSEVKLRIKRRSE